MAALEQLGAAIEYYAADHPLVSRFRWEEHATPGASWSFVITALAIYFAAILLLKLITRSAKSPFPLGVLQILHNFVLLVASATMFCGCLTATFVELRQSKWLWQGSGKSSTEWLFCFPQHTRSAGRIFFWSYVYYISKFYELLDTLIIILRKRRLTLFHVLQHAGNLLVCFSWLHYAQSLQIIFLLSSTCIYTLLYAYFFLTSLGFDPPVKQAVTLCQIFQLFFNVVAYGGLVRLNLRGEACSGRNAADVNAGFNLVLFLLLSNYYYKIYLKKKPANNKGAKRASKKAQ